MLLNEPTALLNEKVLLVPYEAHHVPTYHAWMADEEIRAATASEQLTLDEEYAMQRGWRTDADKLTFIICLAPISPTSPLSEYSEQVLAGHDDSGPAMLGDINLFLSEEHGTTEEFAPDRSHAGKKKVVGELELMIARREHQGKGYGRAAVLLFLWYVVIRREELVASYCAGAGVEGVLTHLRVKIHQDNRRSIGLFESLQFKKSDETPNYFGEYDLILEDLDVVRMYGLMKTYGLGECRTLNYIREQAETLGK